MWLLVKRRKWWNLYTQIGIEIKLCGQQYLCNKCNKRFGENRRTAPAYNFVET